MADLPPKGRMWWAKQRIMRRFKGSRNWKQNMQTFTLRSKHLDEVNDPTWRKKLKPHKQHPRRDRRGQSKPR